MNSRYHLHLQSCGPLLPVFTMMLIDDREAMWVLGRIQDVFCAVLPDSVTSSITLVCEIPNRRRIMSYSDFSINHTQIWNCLSLWKSRNQVIFSISQRINLTRRISMLGVSCIFNTHTGKWDIHGEVFLILLASCKRGVEDWLLVMESFQRCEIWKERGCD